MTTITIPATDARRYRSCSAVLLPMEQPHREPLDGYVYWGSKIIDAHPDDLPKRLEAYAPVQTGDVLVFEYTDEYPHREHWPHETFAINRAVASVEAKRSKELTAEDYRALGFSTLCEHPDLWAWLVGLEAPE